MDKIIIIIIGIILIVFVWKGADYIAQWNKYKELEYKNRELEYKYKQMELFKELIQNKEIQYKELKIGEEEIRK
ncbi:MAG: hypothetical protein ABGX24_04880 [Aquificota bacterium]|jgi:predicted Holliday junction resolvase-like endonuclease